MGHWPNLNGKLWRTWFKKQFMLWFITIKWSIKKHSANLFNYICDIFGYTATRSASKHRETTVLKYSIFYSNHSWIFCFYCWNDHKTTLFPQQYYNNEHGTWGVSIRHFYEFILFNFTAFLIILFMKLGSGVHCAVWRECKSKKWITVRHFLKIIWLLNCNALQMKMNVSWMWQLELPYEFCILNLTDKHQQQIQQMKFKIQKTWGKKWTTTKWEITVHQKKIESSTCKKEEHKVCSYSQ